MSATTVSPTGLKISGDWQKADRTGIERATRLLTRISRLPDTDKARKLLVSAAVNFVRNEMDFTAASILAAALYRTYGTNDERIQAALSLKDSFARAVYENRFALQTLGGDKANAFTLGGLLERPIDIDRNRQDQVNFECSLAETFTGLASQRQPFDIILRPLAVENARKKAIRDAKNPPGEPLRLQRRSGPRIGLPPHNTALDEQGGISLATE